MDAPTTLAPGDVFDRYEIQAFVGEGGMGRVYRAFDRRLQRVVALKVVRAGKGDTDGAVRMVREARAAAALNHPNAVAVFDAGEHDGMAYIAMELVPGRSLRKVVEDASVNEVPIDLRVRWLADVARALAAAHAKGLMHRDVKPENVVVRDDGVVKVLDFGIARRFAVIGATTAAQGDTITQDGTLVGTPLYMAPEQLSGEAIDQRVDQFAWGVLAYELLTGARPWAANDVRAIAAILQQRATPPSERADGIAPHIESTILRALEKKAAQRFASMDELLASLGGAPIVPTTMPAPAEADVDLSRDAVTPKGSQSTARTERARPRWAVGAAAIAIASVAAVIAWGPFGSRSPTLEAPPPSRAVASAPVSPEPQIELRRSIAVLGLRDLAAGADVGAWRSTAVGELLAAQLAAGERLRVVAGERVARARIELGIGDDVALAPDAITKLAKNLGADLVVTGDIVAAKDAPATLTFAIHLVDAKSGSTLATVNDEGTEKDLFALAERMATALRTKIGVDEPAPAEHAVAGSSLPEDAEAARLYAEAIDQQHHFHEARAVELFGEATKRAPNFALGHAHAAESLAHLGHADEATIEAKRALDLSAGLPREDRLWIEATYHAAAHELDDATRAYQALFTFFPDNVDYAAGMLQAMSFAGHPQDALKEIERLRRMPPAISEDPRIDYEEARATHLTNDYDRCLRAAEDCRRRAQARGNLLIYAKAGFADGVARISLGHPDEGLRVLGESRDLAASLGDTYTAHVLEGPMAGEYEKRGDLVRARAVLEGSQAGLIAVGNLYWATSASEQIGWLDVEQGRVEQGRRKIEAAVAYYRHAQQNHALEGGLHALGEIVASQGDPVAGAAMANESRQLAEKSGRKNTVAGAELSLAFIARVAGDAAGEQQHEEVALSLSQANKNESGEARSHHLIGERRWAAGDLAGARHDLEAALHAREAVGQRLDAAESRLALARVALDEGRAADAETMTRDALAVFEPAQAAPLQAQALALLACERAAQGARADADRYRAQASAVAMDDVWAKRRVRIDLARVAGLAANAEQ